MNLNATLLGELIAFAVFVLFCMKFVWPPIMSAIEERQKKIADGLAASDRAEKDLHLAQEKAKEQLLEAKQQAAEIIEQAKRRAGSIVESETQRAHEERDKIVSAGQVEVEAERNRAKEELRKQVSTLAVLGAERILAREIDAQAHSDIVEKLVAEL